ncbi:HPr kinase/phosphorylase [Phreatobacter cathodiphilus]|uniref:HPr kinase/phosphorylase n=1 Tax=Phreatobacter cathodiphilus TaxID=1868589 RepID=UPI001FE69140|nr:HPr kinase/phosphatase C-terminal domain-containing protein [Phreatobacter cathodiphilus]
MATVHATAVLLGARAVLIRGPSGSGKSRLALDVLALAAAGRVPFARLVADDRVALEAHGDRVVARAPAAIGGLVERRGEGIVPLAFELCAVVGLVVDLAAEDAARMPEAASLWTELCGVRLPRLPVAPTVDPAPLVLARSPWCSTPNPVLAASHAYGYR